MAKHTLNVTGTPGTTYDIDKIQEDSRVNSTKKLIVQIHEYHAGENPNPEHPEVGQIWLSRKIEDTIPNEEQ